MAFYPHFWRQRDVGPPGARIGLYGNVYLKERAAHSLHSLLHATVLEILAATARARIITTHTVLADDGVWRRLPLWVICLYSALRFLGWAIG
jgi:hypothetical protein